MREHQQAINPKTGRLEVVFVDLLKVYPNREDPMSEEFSFEELRAKHRGWMDIDWASIRQGRETSENRQANESLVTKPKSEVALLASRETQELAPKPQTVPLKGSVEEELALNDENTPPGHTEGEKVKVSKKTRREERANRTRKIKVMEVKEIRGETQTSKRPSCGTIVKTSF